MFSNSPGIKVSLDLAVEVCIDYESKLNRELLSLVPPLQQTCMLFGALIPHSLSQFPFSSSRLSLPGSLYHIWKVAQDFCVHTYSLDL